MILDEKGFISASEAQKKGVSRFRLAYLADTNELKRVSHGVYALNNDLIDEYGLLQKVAIK